jgi:hypothetical protein
MGSVVYHWNALGELQCRNSEPLGLGEKHAKEPYHLNLILMKLKLLAEKQ